MVSCERCGQALADGAAFCSRCGTATGWSAAPAPATSQATPPPADALRQPSQSDAVEPAKQASNTGLIVVLGVLGAFLLVGLLICGGGAYLFMRSSPSRPVAPPFPPAPTPAPAPLQTVVPQPPPPGNNTTDAPPPTTALLDPVSGLPLNEMERPIPVADRKVRLTIDASTWRPGKKPFDVKAALTAIFKRDGITVVDDPAAKVDGEIAVTYEEKKGERYKPFGAKDEDEEEGAGAGDEPDAAPAKDDPMRSTSVHFTLQLLGADKDNPRLAYEQEETLSSFMTVEQGKTLYDLVIDQFTAGGQPFDLSGLLIGAALRRPDSAAILKRHLIDEEDGETALDALTVGGFKPVTPEDRAYWALATGDFDKAAKEKAAAVPVLVAYYQHRSNVGDVDGRCTAVETIGEIGGADAGAFVTGELKGFVVQRPDGYEEGEEPDESDAVVVALVRAASEMKLKTANKELTQLCNDPNDQLATAARRAVKNLGLPEPKILPKVIKPKPVEEVPQPEAPAAPAAP